ncbi:MAG: hypothetical protein ACYTGG_10665 [Planctomycetota bacterium]|jgi:hypothetical protein
MPISSRSFTVCATVLVAAGAAHAQEDCSWTIEANPTFEGAETIPVFVVPFGADSAVGFRNAQTQDGWRVLRMEWDGAAWTVVSADLIPLDGGADLRAVWGSAPNDIWGTGLTAVDAHGTPFIAHFDGQEWSAWEGESLPDPSPDGGDPLRNTEASAITVITPDDIWVAGIGSAIQFAVSAGVVFHWDGSTLEEIGPPPEVYTRSNHLYSIAAVNSNDVWAVGHGRHTGGNYHLLAYHWDGSSWQPELGWTPLPGQDVVSEHLREVLAFPNGDVWAIGDKLVLEDGTTHSASMYLKWTGDTWTEIAGPDIGPTWSAASSGPDNIWASVPFGEYGGNLAHYDGASWSQVTTASIPQATHIGLGGLATSGDCDVWAFGYWAIYDGAGGWEVYEDLIEHLAPGTLTPGDLDGDGQVAISDLLQLLAAWGACSEPCPPSCPEDLDGDCTVGITDLLVLLGNWS